MDEAIDIRKIHIGADHAGLEYKKEISKHLQKLGYEVEDHGAFELDPADDYPDFILPVAVSVHEDRDTMGIVLGGSGQGEAIVANRVPGIRAVVFNGQYESSGKEVPNEIVTARNHNDANVLSLGARFISLEEALEAVDLFLETGFSGEERHLRRIAKIDNLDQLMASPEPES
jgi:ribose 5-phosphate isomerase B